MNYPEEKKIIEEFSILQYEITIARIVAVNIKTWYQGCLASS